MESDSAMDLSLSRGSNSPPGRSRAVPIVRPTPRPPWSIVWYQNLWSLTNSNNNNNNNNGDDNNNNNNSNIGGTHSFSVLNCLNTNQTANAFIPPHHQSEEHHHHHSNSYVRFPNENRPYYQCTTPPTRASPSPQTILDKHHCGVIGPTLGTSNQSEECYGKIKEAQDQRDPDNLENIIASPTPCSSDSSKSVPKSSGFSIPTAAALLESHQTTVVVDIACCDGPVQFKRVSNPNFALTVEHRSEVVPDSPTSSISNNTNKTTTSSNTSLVSPQSGQSQNSGDDAPDTCQAQSPTRHSVSQRRSTVSGSTSGGTVTALKTYLCIYCNQSFKSLFCYQKHKKRHLNPVSVDITTTTANNSTSQRTSASAATSSGNGGGGHQLYHNNANNHNKNNNTSSNCSASTVGGVGGGGSSVVIGIVPDISKAKTKDLNVQFFPCKKCGCKFPSYYFVHKHRKICH